MENSQNNIERDKKKETIFRFIWNKILDPEALLFELGKTIALLVGCLIIIERMIEFYINFPSGIKMGNIFNIGYMFAIASIPIALSYYFLSEIFGENNG